LGVRVISAGVGSDYFTNSNAI